ncbi:MAG: hypothetical protein UT84_C0003G0090 [Candidatus Curtissbacteria bacterium GW2011_GWA1_40_16]|uniref:Type II secretion system protein GspG C-terminal domain-containing protein n=1 Tax=Candidatus Curtissbacteria bacterium GW2011_GWA1_40_16 TaxID=1618405 RepID=A0A0G0TVM1_9BACT|nr:MAG: hypothetical protein UT84_C0003G0090 [Candidatus Curtissbacteria bacterium GW2011_GWA1_40_16]
MPIIAGVILVGTLGVGSYVQEEAMDVVLRYNLSQISQVLEIYYVENGKYPESLDMLVKSGEVKNINIGDYKYLAVGDGQKAAVLGTKSYCWRSEDGKVRGTTSESSCLP